MGYFFGFVSVFLMASGPVLNKFVVLSISPMAAGLINCGIATLFFAVLNLSRGSKRENKFCPRLMAAGILNGLGLVGLYISLQSVHPATVGLINRLGIVFAMALSMIFLQLRPKIAEIVFAVMAIVGAAGSVGAQFFGVQFAGVLLAVGSVLAFTGSQFFLKLAADTRSHARILLEMNLWSLGVFVLGALVSSRSLTWPSDERQWGLVVLASMTGSCVGIFFYLKSLHKLSFAMATILRATNPVFTALIAIPFFGFDFNMWQTSSAALLVFSIIGHALYVSSVR